MRRVVDYQHLGICHDPVRRVIDDTGDRTRSRGLTDAHARQQKKHEW